MLIDPREREFTTAWSRWVYLNPFDHPETRSLHEQLHRPGLDIEEAAQRRPPVATPRLFVDGLTRRVEALLARLNERLRAGARPDDQAEMHAYEDLYFAPIYFRWFDGDDLLQAAGDGTARIAAYPAFVAACREWTDVPVELGQFFRDPARMFAILFQLRRSFALVSTLLQGNSRPAARLRGAVWNSIFPHERRLYGTLLFDRMHEVTTLILGPSGTGKELVATAIGLSRFVPFDARRHCFTEAFGGAFHPINLSALPGDLVESEMFGHCAGSFTGAVKDRVGWFERCASGHSVFLDEIGELSPAVQVKLLRVLQSREFYRVGETDPRGFAGRIIAATNRDLGNEITGGRFRADLYFRLCSDVVRTPSLRDQLDDCPSDLPVLVRLIALKCLSSRAWPEQIDWLTDLSVNWIENSPEVGTTYAWPGNFRELEQCVRSIMVRGEYHPPLAPQQLAAATNRAQSSAPSMTPGGGALNRFVAQLRAGELSLDEVLAGYCSLIMARSPNLAAAARKLGKHRATVQERIDPKLVADFRAG
ncbi:MAG: sigma 54-interacting transcriptional regulator [Pirellulaceae bacterium]|nr:sigma 54-interacting transcriptional regulator [Pirellulaceae bacterium]